MLTSALLQGEHPIRKVEKKKKTNAAFHFHRDIFISFLERIKILGALAGGRTIKRLQLPCFHEECHSVSLMQRFYSC